MLSTLGLRRSPVLITVVVLGVTFGVFGWRLGYREVGAYVTFALLAGLLVHTAWNVTSWISPADATAETVVRTATIAFALVVICALTLGSLGRLTLGSFIALQGVAWAVSWRWRAPSSEPRTGEIVAVPSWIAGVLGALLAFAIAFGLTHSPLTLYDSLSYHLFFPARWLQERALSIVPTPFSDEAQAYAPANGELFFLWLMLPFHGDLLARIGQLPFALLAALTLYLLGRRLGASPRTAIYPAVFFLLSRPVLEQAIGANVDLICAAMFLTSLYLGIVAVDLDRRRDWALWGVSVGLYAGTKYLALVYLPVLLIVAFLGRLSTRRLWAVPAIAGIGLSWYARNWIVAGSPIYPATLSIAGLTVARGAFGREAMLNTVFHTNNVGLLGPILAHAFGPTLFLVWIPAAIAGSFALARGAWWPHRFVLALPLVMAALFWLTLPVNVDSRFLMPALAPALLVFAFLFQDQGARRNVAMHVLLFAAMAWMLVGTQTSLTASTPWFMDGWLALNGLLSRPFVPAFALVAATIAAAWQLTSARTRWALPLFIALIAGATTMLAAGAERWCGTETCAYLDTTSPYIRAGLLDAWTWSAAHTQGETIAYTGINLPYPLTGRQLTNRVVYVNIDGRPRWRFHDYDRAYRAGRFDPFPPVLAASSGELLPVQQRPGPHDDAVRPRYERMQGLRDAWIDNLRQLNVDDLFVSRLSPYEVAYVWHNADGFPIEDDWAAADSQSFPLVYSNTQVHMYNVRVRREPR